jgi:RecB family endonuclease NucS
MRAVIPQDSFLLKRGVKPIPRHMTTVAGTADILGRTRL